MKRAKGDGYFVKAETHSYSPTGQVCGQETPASCVAACCRMLLFDDVPQSVFRYQYAESFLRAALKTDHKGTSLAAASAVLREYGLSHTYEYQSALTLMELRTAVAGAPALVYLKAPDDDEFHAVLLDHIDHAAVSLRDPLPESVGSAYRIALKLFLPHWVKQETQCGRAVIMVK